MKKENSGADGPLVRSRVVRGIAILALNAPPSNVLTGPLRAELFDLVVRFENEDGVQGIVLLAEGRFFSTGLGVAEADLLAPAEPDLAALCNRIEACRKPVVVVAHGIVSAGGAELVMAGHYRLATTDATFGLPEIGLGLLPRAGGVQRLVRLIGADAALRLLLSGKAVNGQTAQDVGLVDGVVTGDAGSAGHAFAVSLVEKGEGPRATGLMRGKLDGAAVMQLVSATRAALPARALVAARRVVDCVEASAVLPFEAALAFEAEAFADCVADPVSKALRHVHRAERRISSGLLAPNGKGGRSPTEAGRKVISAMAAAQERAHAWLLSNGVTEAALDAAYLDWGFVRTPFGGTSADGPDPQVKPRVTAAIAAAGARQLEAGAVARASDIDVLAVHGLGFARRAGGPLFSLEQAGLSASLRQMREWVRDDRMWAATPLMVAAGGLAGGFAAVEASASSLE